MTIGRVGVWVCSPTKLRKKNNKNKTFNKRKNRALLTVRRSQKHYEIFIIDLSDEYIFGYVQRVLTSAEVLFFPQKTQPLLLAR